MNLLIFFALPLATILLAIVFQKILRCPILVAITFFAIYLIILFALYAAGVITNLAGGLIAVIIYTIIAFITAWLVRLARLIRNCLLNCDDNENEGRSGRNGRNGSGRGGRERERESSCCCGCNNENNENENNDLLRISCRCNNGNSQNLLTINSDCLGTAEDNNNANGCGCSNNNEIAVANNGVSVSGNVIPNQANCGRTGWIRGCYRRY